MFDSRKKYPLLSGVLSFLFPGAGQLYNEEYRKGLILIAAAIATIVSIVYSGLSIGNEMMSGAFPPPTALVINIVSSALILFGLWLYGIIDSVISAQRISCNQSSTDFQSEASRQKPTENAIGLGTFLIIIGILGVLNLLGLRLHLLIQYGWPFALILLGSYLLAKSTGILKGDQ